MYEDKAINQWSAFRDMASAVEKSHAWAAKKIWSQTELSVTKMNEVFPYIVLVLPFCRFRFKLNFLKVQCVFILCGLRNREKGEGCFNEGLLLSF